MLKLLMIREQIKKIYGKNNLFLDPVIKFIIALVSMIFINKNIGVVSILKNPVVVIAVSIVCAVLPKTLMVMLLIIVMLAHIASISITSAAVVAVSYIIMYLLFFRFTAKYSYVLLAMPLLFFVKIPFVMPILLGLSATPIAIIPMIFGTLIYFYFNYFALNLDKLISTSSDDAMTMMTTMASSIFGNPTFFFTVGSFAAVVILVYIIKRTSIDNSWMISAIAGGILSMLSIVIGCNIFDMKDVFSIAGVIIGGIISTIIAWFIQFFIHSVDYKRTEITQFEDDEYYYYVKAVPKIQVLSPEKSIKRINAKKASTKKRK